MRIEAGQRIGDYQVVRALGVGGLGAVYQVKHLISGRFEAMKVLLTERPESPETAERFHREIKVLASLNHLNIAGLHNAFYHGDQLVMIMEFVEGQTLSSLSRKGPIPVASSANWISQVLSALRVAHAAGIIHRDIKPSNVMLTPDGTVKLLDFGIAYSEQSTHLTRAGLIIGTVNYMSPEQFSGDRVTALSDIYSVGVTLYELLTGRLPISGSTTFDIMNGHLYTVPPSPTSLNPNLPEFLSRAADRALAKDPSRRFPSANEFRNALQFPVQETVAAPHRHAPGSPIHASGNVTNPPSQPVTASAGHLPVEEVTLRLAAYIGPVARLVVRKLAPACGTADQLYQEAAKEISSPEERAQFLRSCHR
ncbi:MAG TPA: serine/threonine-protein kinase [Bryobacteraceae bacterium]|jgi:serine/threonine-protein kinase|nr:serine/threonine-protein kinase [Bryobacteraceae bacterium]